MAEGQAEADPHFGVDVGGHTVVDRIIQAGVYNEALRQAAEPTFPQFVAVPDRNPNFTGRAPELAEIAPPSPGGAGGPVTTVIAQVATGLGGVGKTAVAVEHCHRRRPSTDVVRWLDAENRQTLVTQYTRMAPALGIEVAGLQVDDVVARVRHWFETTGRTWLLVFDNAEAPRSLDGLLPTGGNGRVLVTSRHQDWSRSPARVVRIDVLDVADAVEILTTIAGREPSADAEALVHALGCLALAVEQAAAFCRETGWSFAEYRAHLDDRSQELLDRNPAGVHRPSGQDVTVLTVWQSSVDRAADEAVGARAVLEVLAHVGADLFPTMLLAAPFAADEAILRNGDRLYVDEALAALARYSLAELMRDPASGELLAVSVHRLVQEVTRLSARVEGDAEGGAIALRLLHRSFPGDPTRPDTWPACELLEPHVLAALASAEATDREPEARAWLLDVYATYVQHAGNPMAAPALFERALRVHVEDLDEKVLWRRRGRLARAFLAAGRIAEAIDLLEQMLVDHEHGLDQDGADGLVVRADLAAAFESAGRVSDAILLKQQIVGESRRILGDDHRNVLAIRANLALSLQTAGRWAEATSAFEQLLADGERILEPDDADLLALRSDLARAYLAGGRTAEAIALLELVLPERRRALGRHHPDALHTLADLGAAYLSADRWAEALPLLEEALTERERIFGRDHPGPVSTRVNIAVALAAAGRGAEALVREEELLPDCIRVLGEDHPDTLNVRANLAISYWDARRPAEAIALLEQVLAAQDRVRGPEHPESQAVRGVLEIWRAGGAEG